MILRVFYIANLFRTNKEGGFCILFLGSSGAVCTSLVHTQWLLRVLQRALLVVCIV